MKSLSRAIVLLSLSFGIASCSQEQADEASSPRTAAPIEVGVITLSGQSLPRTIDLPGRVVASATAEIRPQVNGLVRKVAFREGRRVAAGDVLYELEDTKFKAAYAAAAALKKAEAATAGANATFTRAEKLAATNAVSTQTLDDARTALLQAQADEEAAKASVETARINLDNATIRAPIGGEIGVSAVSVGALVTENQTNAMATIRQVDPVYVDLVDTSANLLLVRDEMDAGRLGRDRSAPTSVALTLENGKEYGSKGTISFTEMLISQTTGTFTVRVTYLNPDRILVPGMFVRARIDLGEMPNTFPVPQRAVTRDDAGDATLYVANDGKAVQRSVTTAGSVGNNWIVVAGIKEGDRLIVDGFQKISDGSAINAVAAQINEDGVVTQALETSSAATKETVK